VRFRAHHPPAYRQRTMSGLARRKKGGKDRIKGAPVAAVPMSEAEYAALTADAARMVEECNPTGAILLYEAALEQRPDDVDCLSALGTLQYHEGNHDDAVALLERAAVLQPDAGNGKWLLLGQLREGAEAVVAFQRGIALAGSELDGTLPHVRRLISDAYCSLAELYMSDLCDEEGAEAACEGYCKQAFELDDSNPEAAAAWGNLKMCQKDTAGAVPLLSRAVDLIEALYPADSDSDDEEGDDAEGVGAGADADASRPARAGAGAAAEGAGMTIDDAAAAGLLPPPDSRLALAKNCMEAEVYDKALVLLERLLAEDDSNMEVWYLAGEACYLSGDLETAREHLTTADEMLTAALDRVRASARRAGRRAKGNVAGSGSVADAVASMGGLMALDAEELEAQRAMIRKLAAVVADAEAGAAGAGASAGGGTEGAPGADEDM